MCAWSVKKTEEDVSEEGDLIRGVKPGLVLGAGLEPAHPEDTRF
jgi:hypothetical protein